MTAKADLTARTFRSALVGFCKVCCCYTEPYETECPNGCFTSEYSYRYASQRQRRVLVCSECAMCFFSKKSQESTQEAEEHDCYSIY